MPIPFLPRALISPHLRPRGGPGAQGPPQGPPTMVCTRPAEHPSSWKLMSIHPQHFKLILQARKTILRRVGQSEETHASSCPAPEGLGEGSLTLMPPAIISRKHLIFCRAGPGLGQGGMAAARLLRFWRLSSSGDISGLIWLPPQHVPFPSLGLGLPSSMGVAITSYPSPMGAFRSTK